MTDASGNALYYDTKPLPGGDITYGVYTDSSCTIDSTLTRTETKSTVAPGSTGPIESVSRAKHYVVKPISALVQVMRKDEIGHTDR